MSLSSVGAFTRFFSFNTIAAAAVLGLLTGTAAADVRGELFNPADNVANPALPDYMKAVRTVTVGN